MRHVEVLAKIQGGVAAQIYPNLCDFERYPEHSDAVRTVSVIESEDGPLSSNWEVNFRSGILRWTEEDRFNPDTYSVSFRQIDGDVDYFSGEWALSEEDDGCLIRFAADFDMGIPSLSDIIDPIAEQALRDNVKSIITGLIRQPVEFIQDNSADPTQL